MAGAHGVSLRVRKRRGKRVAEGRMRAACPCGLGSAGARCASYARRKYPIFGAR